MIPTIHTGTTDGRHWVTHTDGRHGVMSFTACGLTRGQGTYPPVDMPSACLTCRECGRQREAYELATLTTTMEVTA